MGVSDLTSLTVNYQIYKMKVMMSTLKGCSKDQMQQHV